MAHIFAAPNPKLHLDGSQGGVRYCLHHLPRILIEWRRLQGGVFVLPRIDAVIGIGKRQKLRV
jgi:hypothetical protein